MRFNEQGLVNSKDGPVIKQVFQYLASSLNTFKDVETRLTKTWSAYNKMSSIWKSDLDQPIIIHFFRVALEGILLYGSFQLQKIHKSTQTSCQDHTAKKENLPELMEN